MIWIFNQKDRVKRYRDHYRGFCMSSPTFRDLYRWVGVINSVVSVYSVFQFEIQSKHTINLNFFSLCFLPFFQVKNSNQSVGILSTVIGMGFLHNYDDVVIPLADILMFQVIPIF